MDSVGSWLQKFQPSNSKKDSTTKQYIENHYKEQMKSLRERRERYFSSRNLLLVECMSVKNATNFCFFYPRRMMRKTCNFGLCYFEL
ncbi:unnamed protein product [Camellia sinensis]